MRRNGRSVTPVIGAKMTGVAIRTGPMEMGFSRDIGGGHIIALPLPGKFAIVPGRP